MFRTLLALVIGRPLEINELISFAVGKSGDIFALLFSSLIIRVILELCGQRWIRTFAHTATLIVLPIITYVITSLISGNIALSLGMVGALSIVRFRNPVRSPLELSVYFGAITMGIATSVNYNWLFLFILAILITTLFISISAFILKVIFKKKLFIVSFSEGNSLSTFEVVALNNIDFLDNSKLLKSKQLTEKSKKYLLASNDFDSLKILVREIEKEQGIISYQLNE